MLCLTCTEIRVETAGNVCPVCGLSLLPATPEFLEDFIQERFRRRLQNWRAEGLLDPDTEQRLLHDLLLRDMPAAPPDVLPEEPLVVPPPEPPPTLEQRADALADRLGALEGWRPSWGQSFFKSLEARASREREDRSVRHGAGEEDGLDLASDSGQALFHRVDAGALGGLEAMAALDGDAADTSDAAPRLHEYVWWFLGAVLVLGGSLMGVREAWRALGGVPRQVLVSGALFAYHAAFIGLGVFLARRSAPVGRVLASIGLVLLPVVYVALSALVALEPLLGGGVAAGITALTLLTLRPTARLLYRASPLSFVVALVPSLLASLPLMGLEEAPWDRALWAGAGVVALGGAAWRGREQEGNRATLSTLLTGLYGALFLAVFAVGSAPEGFETFAPGEPLLTTMTLWGLLLAATLAAIASRPGMREAYPRAAPVVETIACAVVASAALLGLTSALSLSPRGDLDQGLALALTPMVAALVYFLLMSRRPALVHAGALALGLSGALLGRMNMPEAPRAWLVGLTAVGSGLLFVARVSRPGHARPRLLGWGVGLSVVALGLFIPDLSFDYFSAPRGVSHAALFVAFAAHVTGGYRWRGLHYLGGFAMLVWLTEGPSRSLDAWILPFETQLFALTLLYAGAGLLQEAWIKSRTGSGENLLPLDDVSLAFATLGALTFTTVLSVDPTQLIVLRHFSPEPSWPVLELFQLALPLVGLLLLRARRERSWLVSALAAWALACASWPLFFRLIDGGRLTGGSLADMRALHLAGVALAFSFLASLRGRDPTVAPEDAPKGRKVLGFIPMLGAASGRVLYTNGFGIVALALIPLTLFNLGEWMTVPMEAGRGHVVLAGAMLTASAGLAFLTRGFVTRWLRGAVLTLVLGALFAVLTAVLNRLGRPLPPDVAALRLTCVGVGLWGVMLLTRRFGPALGRFLGKPTHGESYVLVPFLGVFGLWLLLALEPLWVGGPELTRAMTVVPPLFPLGAGLLALLLAGSLYARRFYLTLGLFFGLPGAALWAVHGTPLGHALVDLEPPAGRWARADLQDAARLTSWIFREAWLEPWETVASVWYRAVIGVAAAGLVYAAAALVLSRFEALHHFVTRAKGSLQQWARIAAGLAFGAAFFQPGLEAALLTLGTGLLLLALRSSRSLGRQVSGLGVLLLVHALAHRTAVLPDWPGPVLALLGLTVVVLGPLVARWRKHDLERARAQAQFGALFYGLHAAVYALASGGRAQPEFAMPAVLFNALVQLWDASWTQRAALPATLALLALTLYVGAAQWKGALARVGAAWGTLTAEATTVTALTVALVAFLTPLDPASRYSSLLSLQGPTLALGLAGASLLAHLARRGLRTSRADLSRGLAWGRDAGLLATGGVLALLAAGGEVENEYALPLVLAALGVAVGVSLHAAWREQTGRHVYFVQVSAVGVYALVRALYARGLSPEHDALFALALGFVLVGVTVMARRAGIPPVARATRRFAALLPLGMALVLPREATGEAALLAGGSGFLYAALGAVERSRWFGSLAAVACNAALLVGALSFGLEGIEIFLAPLGLLLLMLSQLFTRGLPHAARNALRVVGGLLLYVPAAAKVALRVGMAEDGTYAVVFGAVCLLGVMVGMVLRIRAYLALGTLFLVLTIASTLVHAGLRDHRVGFLVMTVAGLAIFGGRILTTLNREQFDLLWRRARVAIRGWD